MSEKQTFLKDKSYGFVPLLETCKREKRLSQHTFDAGTFSGKLKIKLIIQSPLHIGKNKQTMRCNEKVVILGSSIKGIVRGIAEAVSYSCAVKLPDTRVRYLEKALPHLNKNSCNKIQSLCAVCSTFGMASKFENYKGKVVFGEFICTKEENVHTERFVQMESPFKNYPTRSDIPNYWSYGNERLYYCQACTSGNCDICDKEFYFMKTKEAGKDRAVKFRGRKFYYSDKIEIKSHEETGTKKWTVIETLGKGSELEGEIIFQNLKKEELELLAYSLNLGNHFQIKFGYGKPLGFGKTKIELVEVEDMYSRYTRKSNLTKEKLFDMALCYKKDAPKDIRNAIECLEQIMR